MDKIYIDIREENEWIRKYFKKDLVTIDEILGVIEDLDGEIENLNEKIEELENPEPEWEHQWNERFNNCREIMEERNEC